MGLDREMLARELLMFSYLSTDDGNIEYAEGGIYTLEAIMNAVCRIHGIDEEFLRRRTRLRKNLTPRQEFYYMAKKFSEHSLAEIGDYAGGFDHTTALHGSGVIEGLLVIPGNHQIKLDIQLIFHKLRMP